MIWVGKRKERRLNKRWIGAYRAGEGGAGRGRGAGKKSFSSSHGETRDARLSIRRSGDVTRSYLARRSIKEAPPSTTLMGVCLDTCLVMCVDWSDVLQMS